MSLSAAEVATRGTFGTTGDDSNMFRHILSSFLLCFAFPDKVFSSSTFNLLCLLSLFTHTSVLQYKRSRKLNLCARVYGVPHSWQWTSSSGPRAINALTQSTNLTLLTSIS
jgi:hypothetical protein